jgi:hypothetical protein
MGLGAVFKRDVGHAMILVVIALIVGLFVYDPAGAQSAIRTIVKQIARQ